MALQRRLRLVHPSIERKIGMNGKRYRIAFATSDMATVNQHFGSAGAFAIYEVDERQASLAEALEFGSLAQDGDEDKLDDKLCALTGCDAVYCLAVGGSALKRLIAVGVGAVKVDKGSTIAQQLVRLRETLRAGEMPWPTVPAAKPRNDNPARFEQMEADGWEE